VSGFDFLHPAINEMSAKTTASESANAHRFRRADSPRLKENAITRDILANRDEKLK
jgi:hypothetical protein